MKLRYRRRERRPRLKGMPINRLLPNVLTTLALCAGMTAIRFAIQAQWRAAVIAILVAALLDALDGRIARLLNGQSKFGAELDSLSDAISFGVAPAMLLFLWVMKNGGGLGWVSVLAFTVCSALRLARFNAKLGESDLPPWAFNYFTGVPAPAGAGLALLPLIASFEIGPGIVGHPLVVGIWTVLVALLMVSRLPTFSLKGIRVPHRHIVPVLVVVGLVAASLVSAPWATLALIGLAYLMSLPFSLRQFRALEREAYRLQAEAASEQGRPPPPSLPANLVAPVTTDDEDD